jgi:hypothetical protein
MANNLLEKKLECESRLMRLIMQDTHPSPPLSPNMQSCFCSFDFGCLASFSHEDNFEYGERGPYHNSFKFFFKRVGRYDGSIQIHLYTVSVQ